jgi:hypothetical protein
MSQKINKINFERAAKQIQQNGFTIVTGNRALPFTV